VNDNHMVINGVRYPVIEAWPEAYDSGRFRWAVVTEGQETAGACHCGAPATAGPHPDVRAEAQPAEATAAEDVLDARDATMRAAGHPTV